MMGEIRTAVYPAPPVNRREALRYAGAREDDAASCALLDECVSLAWDTFRYRVAYAMFPVTPSEDGLDLGFARVRSRALSTCLAGCERVVVLGATVGLEIDRLVARYTTVSPAKGLMLDALGGERVESLADAFCAELAQRLATEGCTLRPRFSPGYGDLPLTVQRDIFRALDLSRKIGITLNDSLLMTPRKSVTALVGICACPKENV